MSDTTNDTAQQQGARARVLGRGAARQDPVPRRRRGLAPAHVGRPAGLPGEGPPGRAGARALHRIDRRSTNPTAPGTSTTSLAEDDLVTLHCTMHTRARPPATSTTARTTCCSASPTARSPKRGSSSTPPTCSSAWCRRPTVDHAPRSGYSAEATAFFMRREVRRAAAFLWMRPFDAALSMRFCASRTASGASSAPVSIAVVARLGAGLQLGAHALVAEAPLLVRAVPLDLALDVRHGACSAPLESSGEEGHSSDRSD